MDSLNGNSQEATAQVNATLNGSEKSQKIAALSDAFVCLQEKEYSRMEQPLKNLSASSNQQHALSTISMVSGEKLIHPKISFSEKLTDSKLFY